VQVRYFYEGFQCLFIDFMSKRHQLLASKCAYDMIYRANWPEKTTKICKDVRIKCLNAPVIVDPDTVYIYETRCNVIFLRGQE